VKDIHNDCFQPDPDRLVELFFTNSIIQAMSTDENIRVIKAKYTLVDGGSAPNLVPKSVVKTLKAKVMPVTDVSFEVADGKVAEPKSIAWLMVNVAGVSRIIAAWVIDAKPEYTLLLG